MFTGLVTLFGFSVLFGLIVVKNDEREGRIILKVQRTDSGVLWCEYSNTVFLLRKAKLEEI
jgi:hypothetical protein